MSDLESVEMKRIQISASKTGFRLFRNNSGVGWVGKATHGNPGRPIQVVVGPDDVYIRNARPLHAGLCKGSSDLIGLLPLEITQDMVGKKMAVFLAAEVKRPGQHPTVEQSSFIEFVKSNGGIAGVVTSEEDVERMISEYKGPK